MQLIFRYNKRNREERIDYVERGNSRSGDSSGAGEKGDFQEVVSSFAGIGRTHLSAIERGQRKPTLETFFRLSEALGMAASDLMREIEKEIQKENDKQEEK